MTAPKQAALRTLDAAWQAVARRFGFDVVRERGGFVSYLGDGRIQVAPYDELDEDDCLAQIVFRDYHAALGPDPLRTEGTTGQARQAVARLATDARWPVLEGALAEVARVAGAAGGSFGG